MNKQAKAGGIDWCDWTWNPLTGCKHGCEYCYARLMAERFRGTPNFPNGFEPEFHEDRLAEPSLIKKASRIFVCSMADLFGRWVDDKWLVQVFNAMYAAPQHTYILLTKNPGRMTEYMRAAGPNTKVWWGFSASNAKDYHERHEEMIRVPVAVRWASIEPLHEAFTPDCAGLRWVVVGAETGRRKGLIVPKAEWVEDIIRCARDEDEGLPPRAVFIKKNIPGKWPREYPVEPPQ